MKLVANQKTDYGQPPRPAAPSCRQNAAPVVLATPIVLTTVRSGEAIRLEVAPAEPPAMQFDLSVAQTAVFAGPWKTQLKINGRASRPDGQWRCAARVRKADADYLALTLRFEGGWRLMREIIVARRDRFVLLADTLSGPDRAKLDYRGRLYLAAPWDIKEARHTNEGIISAQRQRLLVLPLGLPEWRTAHGGGRLEASAQGTLQLRQTAEARRLFAPLFLAPSRQGASAPLAWRRLTVAAARRIVPADAAVGYRVALGEEQWLFYRSWGRGSARSVLGQHLRAAVFLARFLRSGTVKPIIQID